jgi:hypothetical protein
MTVSIIFLNGTGQEIKFVEFIHLRGNHTIETQCFGNDPVTHHAVRSFIASFDFTPFDKEVTKS